MRTPDHISLKTSVNRLFALTLARGEEDEEEEKRKEEREEEQRKEEEEEEEGKVPNTDPPRDLYKVSANVASLLSSGLRHLFDLERQQISLAASLGYNTDGELRKRRDETSHVSQRTTAYLIDQLQVLRRDMRSERRSGIWPGFVLVCIKFWDEVWRRSIAASSVVGALVMLLIMRQCTSLAPSPELKPPPCEKTVVEVPKVVVKFVEVPKVVKVPVEVPKVVVKFVKVSKDGEVGDKADVGTKVGESPKPGTQNPPPGEATAPPAKAGGPNGGTTLASTQNPPPGEATAPPDKAGGPNGGTTLASTQNPPPAEGTAPPAKAGGPNGGTTLASTQNSLPGEVTAPPAKAGGPNGGTTLASTQNPPSAEATAPPAKAGGLGSGTTPDSKRNPPRDPTGHTKEKGEPPHAGRSRIPPITGWISGPGEPPRGPIFGGIAGDYEMEPISGEIAGDYEKAPPNSTHSLTPKQCSCTCRQETQ